MEIFNIGPWELVIILILALVVFGPERMVSYSREAAGFIRKIVRSPFWRDLVSTTEEIKTIPRQLAKEADLEESMREISHLGGIIVPPALVAHDSGENEKPEDVSGETNPDDPEVKG
jgi:Sec-independent protein translocase protein TatA